MAISLLEADFWPAWLCLIHSAQRAHKNHTEGNLARGKSGCYPVGNKDLLPTTYAAPAHGSAIWRAESLSRLVFALGAYQFRQLSGISAASRDSAKR